MAGFYAPIKRALDVVLSAAALAALSPLLAAAALAVRIEGPGPTLYRGPRVGRHGRHFEMLKFRTMVVNAPDLRNPDGSTFAGAADPRVTRVGRWLRRTSVDELPQLLNVLRGEMSLVGPRPELPGQTLGDDTDHQRLLVRPGITGLAQVSGRNDLPWRERRQLDVQYVASMTLALDLQILVRTVLQVAGARGIHTRSAEPR